MSHEELLKELRTMELVQGRMRALLSEVAFALKGPPQPGQAHDWGDLPELVERLVAEHKHLKSWWASHMESVSAGYDYVASNLDAVRAAATADGFQRGVRATLQRLEERLPALPEPAVTEADEII